MKWFGEKRQEVPCLESVSVTMRTPPTEDWPYASTSDNALTIKFANNIIEEIDWVVGGRDLDRVNEPSETTPIQDIIKVVRKKAGKERARLAIRASMVTYLMGLSLLTEADLQAVDITVLPDYPNKK